MQRTLKKFLLLLAGSGLSQKEISQIVEELQYLPPGLLADSIHNLRHNALDSLDEVADGLKLVLDGKTSINVVILP